jgi:hypothetical protein
VTPLRPQIDGSTRFDRYPIQDSMVRKLEWELIEFRGWKAKLA